MSLLIRGGRVITAVDDTVADVRIEAGRVVQIGRDLPTSGVDRVIEATGKLVIPGGVDVHTHLDMPMGDSVTADDFRTGTRAAAFGGTTTVVDFAVQDHDASTLDALDAWRQRAQGRACVDYGLHMIITDMPRTRLPELDTLVDRGVTSFKLFMAYPGRVFSDDATHYRTYRRAAQLGARVMLHAENGIVIDEIVRDALAAGHTEPRWHGLTRPPRMAAEAVHRAASIAELAGAALHIVHLDCAEALEQVVAARARGVDITAETCPQYLFLDDSLLDQPGMEGAKYVMSPPLRPHAHQAVLWRGLAQGQIGLVATDHAPFNFADKRKGTQDFTHIPNGGMGIEHRLSLMYQGGVVEGRLGPRALNRWVQVCSTEPARLFGMFPRKGTIAVGSDADIVVFDPDRVETISVSNPFTHHMAVDYSAYEGHTVQGWPITTISRGRVICHEGTQETTGGGQFVARATIGGTLR